ncbi:MAG: hypothetical protein WCG45_04520 [bacterium]
MAETNLEKLKNFFSLFAVLNTLLFLMVIVVNIYFLYFKKDFQFLIEVSCDKTIEQCFERDCTNLDDCPPSGLSTFKRYSLKASDFKYCANEDCKKACEGGQIKCNEIKCIKDSETSWEQVCFNGE